MNPDLAYSAAGFAAGALNALGGGGSFVTLPALVACGFSALQANAIGTVALLPGGYLAAWKYRTRLRRFDAVGTGVLGAASLVGGAIGACLLWRTPVRAFEGVVPWLVLVATVIFAAGPRLIRRPDGPREAGPIWLVAVQLVIGVYTGFYGGGAGIIMVAVWATCTRRDPLELNAMRMVMVPVANTAAAAVLLAAGLAMTRATMILCVTGALGSLVGASILMRLPARAVRHLIIAIGVAVSIGLFARELG